MGRIRVGRTLDGPMKTMGLGLAVAYAGFAADFYVHEIARAAEEAESIWSPVHVPVFAGMAIVALGFLWALWRATAAVQPRNA